MVKKTTTFVNSNPTLHSHHQNGSWIKMGSNEKHFTISLSAFVCKDPRQSVFVCKDPRQRAFVCKDPTQSVPLAGFICFVSTCMPGELL